MKKMISVPLALSLALGGVLAGCGGQGADPGAAPGRSAPLADTKTANDKAAGRANKDIGDGRGGKSESDATYKPADVDQRVMKGHNALGFKLFQDALEGEPGNVFLSPVSAALALSMTMNGASGETLDGMQQALGMKGLTLEDVNRSHRALSDVLAHSGEAVRIDIANSLWMDEGFDFLAPFLDANKIYYGAEASAADLQSDDAVGRINGWVNERTNGKIDSLLDGPLSADAILLLLNAIYFDAAWASPFSEERTTDHPFQRNGGSVIDAPTMFRDGKLMYRDGEGYQAVRIPYQGGSLSMLVFVPDDRESLATFASKLSPEFWSGEMKRFEPASGRLGLPKFRIEYETSLNESLQALGMKLAFDPERADFSAMSGNALETGVHIAEVKQKTYVDVAEQGTVAAAVTGVIMETASAPALTFDLVVDRPFFFAIHDARTDSILFLGAVNDPTAE